MAARVDRQRRFQRPSCHGCGGFGIRFADIKPTDSQYSRASLDFQEACEEFDRMRDGLRVRTQLLRYRHFASRLVLIDHYLDGKLAFFFYMQPRLILDDVRRALEFN